MKVQQWEIDEAIDKAIDDGDLPEDKIEPINCISKHYVQKLVNGEIDERKEHSKGQSGRERDGRKTNNSSHSSKSNLQRNASNQTDEN